MTSDLYKNLQLFSDADDINELTLLLNLAYKKWTDMGFMYLAGRQSAAITKKRISNAKCFILKSDNKIIATVTYYPPLTKINSEHSLYLQADVATYGQLAVHPDFQKRGIAFGLIKHIEQLAKQAGAKRMIIDTAEDNTALVSYYLTMEYRVIDKTNWSATNYTSVFLAKNL